MQIQSIGSTFIPKAVICSLTIYFYIFSLIWALTNVTRTDLLRYRQLLDAPAIKCIQTHATVNKLRCNDPLLRDTALIFCPSKMIFRIHDSKLIISLIWYMYLKRQHTCRHDHLISGDRLRTMPPFHIKRWSTFKMYR